MATTWNPGDKNANVTLSNGNLTASAPNWSTASVRSTDSKNTGKHYFEVLLSANVSATYPGMVGVGTSGAALNTGFYTANIWGWDYSGKIFANGSEVGNYGTPLAGDVIGVALDCGAHTVSFYKNNTFVATASSVAATNIFAMVGVGGQNATGRFLATDCSYSPPSGYSAWDAPSVTTVTCDTLRSITSAVTVPADTSRVLSGPVSVGCDTSRQLAAGVSVPVDTLRQLVRVESVSADTLRELIQTASVTCDTKRRIVGPLSSIKQLTIYLRAQVLGDSFTLDAYTAPAIKTPYGSTLYGWPWEFVVRSKQYNPATRQYSWAGDYDIADLLKRYIDFSSANAVRSDLIMGKVAQQLGKLLVISTDSHYCNLFPLQSTVMDVVSKLYGWTTAIPHRQVSVYVRGGTLYVVQRGMESANYSPAKYNILNISESLVDTLMDSGLAYGKTINVNGTNYTIPFPKVTGESKTIETAAAEEEPYGFTGTFSFGRSSITFANGYNTGTTTTDGDGYTITDCSYNGDGCITWKSVRHFVDGSSDRTEETTSYSYETYDGLPYMSGESTISDTYKGGYLRGSRRSITDYAPLGYNFFGASTITETATFTNWANNWVLTGWKRTGSSSHVSEGRPGGKASPFTIQREGTKGGSEYATPSVTIIRNPIAPANIPVTDVPTLTRYKDGLEWLENKTQYNMSIECYDAHIVDFTETVTINGNVWYLEGNSITIDGDLPCAKQIIELVRWA